MVRSGMRQAAQARATRASGSSHDPAPAPGAEAESPVLCGSEEPGLRRPMRAARPAAPLVTSACRTSTSTTERLATAAIICFYHPEVDRSERPQKQQWADFFGVQRPRFAYWEKKLSESIGAFKRGAVPVPPAPEGKVIKLISDEAVPLLELHGYNLADLKAQLQSQCTRPLDELAYGRHGAWGMYREGTKWAIGEIAAGRLDKGGRKAAAVLNEIGISISCYPLFHGAVDHLANGHAVVKSPTKCGSTEQCWGYLPIEAVERLRTWVFCLRALNIKVGRSMVVGAVNQMIKDTPIAEKFKRSAAGKGWYSSWKRAMKFPRQATPPHTPPPPPQPPTPYPPTSYLPPPPPPLSLRLCGQLTKPALPATTACGRRRCTSSTAHRRTRRARTDASWPCPSRPLLG